VITQSSRVIRITVFTKKSEKLIQILLHILHQYWLLVMTTAVEEMAMHDVSSVKISTQSMIGGGGHGPLAPLWLCPCLITNRTEDMLIQTES